MNLDAPVTGIPGAEGLSHREVLEEIGRGGRFALFPYAISIVLLTFRRSTKVKFFRAGESGAASAWGALLTTAFFGWWGFPWGPIYSIGALFTNLMGGKDVTRDLLATIVGEERATAALKARKKPGVGLGIWGLRAAVLGLPALAIAMPMYAASLLAKQRAALPGYEEFHSVDNSLAEGADGATAADKSTAQDIKAILENTFEDAHPESSRSKMHPVGVWYRSAGTQSVLLVRIGDWSRFSGAERDVVCDLLWKLGCDVAEGKSDAASERRLTVGVRGFSQWLAAMTGSVPSEIPEDWKPRYERIGAAKVPAEIIATFAPIPAP